MLLVTASACAAGSEDDGTGANSTGTAATGGNGTGGNGTGGGPVTCASVQVFGQADTRLLTGFLDGPDFVSYRDVDGDGDRDLVIAGTAGSSVEVSRIINVGGGIAVDATVEVDLTAVSYPIQHPSRPDTIVVADQGAVIWFDIPSMTAARTECPGVEPFGYGVASLDRPFDVDGNGVPEVPGGSDDVLEIGPDNPCEIRAVTLNPGGSFVGQTPASYGQNQLWFSDSAGTYALGEGQGTTNGSADLQPLSDVDRLLRSWFGDVDGDGALELAGVSGNSDLLVVEIGSTPWTLSTFPPLNAGINNGQSGLRDIDCDGDLDFWSAQGLWENVGNGTFVPGVALPVDAFHELVAVEDLSGDGLADFVIVGGSDVIFLEGVAP